MLIRVKGQGGMGGYLQLKQSKYVEQRCLSGLRWTLVSFFLFFFFVKKKKARNAKRRKNAHSVD